MANAKTQGIQGRIMVGAAGSTPTNVLGDDMNATLNVDNELGTWKTRGNPREDSGYGGQKLTVSFEVAKDSTNAQFLLIQAACIGRTPIALKFLDKASGYGWDADWNLSKSGEKQADGVTMVSYEGQLCQASRDLTQILPS